MKIIIPLILLFLIAVIDFFLVGAGGDGKEIARVGKRIFVSFAWGSVYRFPFYSLVLLCFATENGLTQ